MNGLRMHAAGADIHRKKVVNAIRKEVSLGLAWIGATLHGVLSGPFTGSTLVTLTVRLVQVGDLGNKRIIRIWVSEHRTDREQHLGDGQRWTPLVSENVETDAAVAVDVRVVDLGGERNLGGLEGVVGGESD